MSFPMRTMVQGTIFLSLALGWCGCCASFSVNELRAQSVAKAARCYLLGIDGMTCKGCAAHVQKALLKVPGVVEAKVNYAKAEATVCTGSGSNVTGETLVKAVEKAGYKAKVKSRSRD